MTKRSSVVRLAVLLSLGLHVALGWWLLRGDWYLRVSAPQPATTERRLQVTWMPGFIPPDASIPAVTPGLERKMKKVQSTSQTSQTSRTSRTSRTAQTNLQPVERQSVQSLTAMQSSDVAPHSAPSAAAEGVQTVEPKLELNLRLAAQAVERQRRQSPLASIIDDQQMQAGAAKLARAFSNLHPVGSNIVEESIMADGGRVIRFSGGGCMRMPNPSSGNHDDIRRPAMQSC